MITVRTTTTTTTTAITSTPTDMLGGEMRCDMTSKGGWLREEERDERRRKVLQIFPNASTVRAFYSSILLPPLPLLLLLLSCE